MYSAIEIGIESYSLLPMYCAIEIGIESSFSSMSGWNPYVGDV